MSWKYAEDTLSLGEHGPRSTLILVTLVVAAACLIGCGDGEILSTGGDVELIEVAPPTRSQRVLSCSTSPDSCNPDLVTQEGLERQAELHAIVAERLLEEQADPVQVARWLTTQEEVSEVAATRHGVKFHVENSLATHVLAPPQNSATASQELSEQPAGAANSIEELAFRGERFDTTAPTVIPMSSDDGGDRPPNSTMIGGPDNSYVSALIFDPLNGSWGTNESIGESTIEQIRDYTRVGSVVHETGNDATWKVFERLRDYHFIYMMTHGGERDVLFYASSRGSTNKFDTWEREVDDGDPSDSVLVVDYGLYTASPIEYPSWSTGAGGTRECLRTLVDSARDGDLPLVGTLRTPIGWVNSERGETGVLPFACGSASGHPQKFWVTSEFFASKYPEPLDYTSIFMGVCSSASRTVSTTVGEGLSLAQILVGNRPRDGQSVYYGWSDTAPTAKDFFYNHFVKLGRSLYSSGEVATWEMSAEEAYNARCLIENDEQEDTISQECTKWNAEFIQYPSYGAHIYVEQEPPEEESCFDFFSTHAPSTCEGPEPNQWLSVDVIVDSDGSIDLGPDVPQGANDPKGYEVSRIFVRNTTTGEIIEPDQVFIVSADGQKTAIESGGTKLASENTNEDSLTCGPLGGSPDAPYGELPLWDDVSVRFDETLRVRLEAPVPAADEHQVVLVRPADTETVDDNFYKCTASGYASVSLGDGASFPAAATPEGLPGFDASPEHHIPIHKLTSGTCATVSSPPTELCWEPPE